MEQFWPAQRTAPGRPRNVGVFKRSSSLHRRLREIPFWIQGPYLRAYAPRFRTSCCLDPGRRNLCLEVHHRQPRCAGAAPGGRQAAHGPNTYRTHGSVPTDGEGGSAASAPCVAGASGPVAQRGPNDPLGPFLGTCKFTDYPLTKSPDLQVGGCLFKGSGLFRRYSEGINMVSCSQVLGAAQSSALLCHWLLRLAVK